MVQHKAPVGYLRLVATVLAALVLVGAALAALHWTGSNDVSTDAAAPIVATSTSAPLDTATSVPVSPTPVKASAHHRDHAASHASTRATSAAQKRHARETRRLLAQATQRLADLQHPDTPPFTVASFNILGSQHTRGRSGFGPGTSRAAAGTSMLLNRGVSIVGFSEIQSDQMNVLRHDAPAFAVYPGVEAGSLGLPQSVAWDTRVWTMETADTYNIVFSHQVRPQPVVKLKNNVSGAEIWVMNVHNSPEGEQAERDRASAVEVGIIRQLVATGLPIVMTGDFNEKVKAFCTFTGQTPLVSAVGGTNVGGCRPPVHPRVDWVFTSPSLHVDSYLVSRDAPVPSITDHAVLFSTLSLTETS